MEEVMMTANEVSEWLKVNVETIYNLAKNGEIPAVKVGGQWRFSTIHVQHWLDEQAGISLPRSLNQGS